jgi:hypothetical protein
MKLRTSRGALKQHQYNRNANMKIKNDIELTLIVAFAAAVTPAIAVDESAATSAEQPNAIRPFHVHVSDEQLSDLRGRIAATRWPDKETVADPSQGVQLAKLQELLRYWGTDYDWRKAEAKLNALPQFVTTIDGVDIHFIHVRARHQKALPLIITHGWPGSVFEFIKVIGPLTDPTAHGGRATASPASPPAPVGTPSTSRGSGRS